MNRIRKALIAIAVAVAAVTSSCEDFAVTQVQTKTTTEAQRANCGAEIRKMGFSKSTFDGHTYVLYEKPRATNYVGVSIVHDPDCPCQKGGAK